MFALDLGQSRDYAAGVQLHRLPGYHEARAILRWPLGTDYNVIVRDVVAACPPRDRLVVDAGGPGRPVLDMLRASGLDPQGVAITGGGRSNVLPDGVVTVPKLTLVRVLWQAVTDGTFRVAPGCPHASELAAELQAFGWRQRPGARRPRWESQDARVHDDIAVALGLGLWADGLPVAV